MKQDGRVWRAALTYCQHDINKNTTLRPFPLPTWYFTPSNKFTWGNATEIIPTDHHAAVNNPTPARTARWEDIWHSLGCPFVDRERRSGGKALRIWNERGNSSQGQRQPVCCNWALYSQRYSLCGIDLLNFFDKGQPVITDITLIGKLSP